MITKIDKTKCHPFEGVHLISGCHCFERAPMENGTVILKRTFDQSDFQGGFYSNWRVIGPASHRQINSDLAFRHTDVNGIVKFVNPLNGGKWE